MTNTMVSSYMPPALFLCIAEVSSAPEKWLINTDLCSDTADPEANESASGKQRVNASTRFYRLTCT